MKKSILMVLIGFITLFGCGSNTSGGSDNESNKNDSSNENVGDQKTVCRSSGDKMVTTLWSTGNKIVKLEIVQNVKYSDLGIDRAAMERIIESEKDMDKSNGQGNEYILGDDGYQSKIEADFRGMSKAEIEKLGYVVTEDGGLDLERFVKNYESLGDVCKLEK